MRVGLAFRIGLFLGLVPAVSLQGQTADVLRSRFETRVQERALAVDGVLGVWIMDLQSGAEFGVDADELFPTASSIKIAVLVELYRQVGEGRLDLAERHRVTASERVGGSGVLGVLGDGTVELTLKDLAVLMVLVSDNTSTNILIDRVGMEAVNETLARIGIEQTRLRRKMMRPDEQASGNENVSTPAELGRLLALLHRQAILTPEACREVLDILALPKPGPIPSGLPEGVRVAHKTGSLDGVRNDVGLVELEGRPFIISAMSSWMLDPEEASAAISDIAAMAYDYFSRLAHSNEFGAGLPP